jgi:hypothetical protein
LVGADDRDVTFRERDGDIRHFRFDEIQSVLFNPGGRNFDSGRNYPPPPPPPPPPRQEQRYDRGNMIVPAGADVAIRTNESIDSRDASESRSYEAEVDRDVPDTNGNVVIPRGSRAWLVVRRIRDNQLALDLQSVEVNGQRFSVDSDEVSTSNRQGVGENKRTGEFVGGGAVLGAVIGAIAGGGKGAGIGALAGGAAGAGAQVLTRGDHVHVPAESVVNFRLDSRVNLRPIRQ